MLSPKNPHASMAPPQIATCLFYPETPPKKSRLEDKPVSHPSVVETKGKLSEPAGSSAAKTITSITQRSNNISETPTCSGRESPLPLKNLGNTCYENSIIQCLFSLEMFMDNLNRSLGANSKQPVDQADFRYRILNAFLRLHSCYNESVLSPLDGEQRQEQQQQLEGRLEDLKSAVGERSSQFNSTHQQDASEFFYHIIDSIQEYYQSLNKTDEDDNPVTQAFEFELDYMMRCPKCHHKIISESEKIRTLPLALPQSNRNDEDANRIPTPPSSEPETDQINDDISSSQQSTTQPQTERSRFTLSDALDNYFKDETLEYKCSQPNCDSTQRTRKCLIRKLPQVLFITLARYSHSGKKSLEEIDAPFKLSVPFEEHKSPSHSPAAYKGFGDADSNYHLVAVVCHLGSSLDAGHYTSYVYNQISSSWYSCDDDSITKVQETNVKNDARKSGYCFFYAHKSCINMSKEEPQKSGLHELRTISPNLSQPNYVVESSTVMTPESSPSPLNSMSEDK